MSLSAEERGAVVMFRIEKSTRAYEQAKGVLPYVEPTGKLIAQTAELAKQLLEQS